MQAKRDGSFEHFRGFATSLEKAIARLAEGDDEVFLVRQKRQFDALVALEKDFRQTLIAGAHGERVYRAFVRYICDERRNILDARPYFRERQATFTAHISEALRRRNVRALYRYRFNHRFVQFALGCRAWKPRSPVVTIARQIAEVRGDLVTMNLPLAISRARIFFGRTPQAHLSYMDLVQIAAEGLMAGVDKFVPPYTRMFRGVAVGRITGNFISSYSETPIHFYPIDKRKIYRANKVAGRRVDAADYEELARQVNDGLQERSHRTNPAEIASLMAAASVVSADADDREDADGTPTRQVDRFAAPEEARPDVTAERREVGAALHEGIVSLTTLERKLLLLRGVDL